MRCSSLACALHRAPPGTSSTAATVKLHSCGQRRRHVVSSGSNTPAGISSQHPPPPCNPKGPAHSPLASKLPKQANTVQINSENFQPTGYTRQLRSATQYPLLQPVPCYLTMAELATAATAATAGQPSSGCNQARHTTSSAQHPMLLPLQQVQARPSLTAKRHAAHQQQQAVKLQHDGQHSKQADAARSTDGSHGRNP